MLPEVSSWDAERSLGKGNGRRLSGFVWILYKLPIRIECHEEQSGYPCWP